MDVGSETANRENNNCKDDPGFQLRNFEAVAEGVDDVAKHGAT
jgi:hypothetical protein